MRVVKKVKIVLAHTLYWWILIFFLLPNQMDFVVLLQIKMIYYIRVALYKSISRKRVKCVRKREFALDHFRCVLSLEWEIVLYTCILVRIKEDYPMLSWEEFLSSLRAYVQDFQKTKSCYKGKKLIETNNVISVLMDL